MAHHVIVRIARLSDRAHNITSGIARFSAGAPHLTAEITKLSARVHDLTTGIARFSDRAR